MHFLFKIFFISILLLLTPKTARSEFVRLREDQTQTCSIQLAEARNIQHQCLVIADESSPLEFWENRLSFEFGKISEQDFIYLKNTYGSWSNSQTAVEYNPNKSYQLIDFLPPFIQALNSHRFIPEEILLKNEYGENDLKQYLYMNCWGLVYEVLRAARDSQAKPTIFMAQASLMLAQLRNNSDLVLPLQEPSEFPISGKLSKPGDMILVMHQSSAGYEYLDHIAIAIADGIYFEKAGTGKDVPIRIIDEATLIKIWPPGVFHYELRRLHQNAVLGDPKEIFSLDSPEIQEQFVHLAEIPLNISKNTSITWDVESKSLASISWFHIIDISPLSRDDTGKARLTDNLYQPLLREN